MSDTLERLRAGMGHGEIFRIRYDGGSQAGATRDIIPVALERDDAIVRARCYTSGAVKQFKVEKITILEIVPASLANEWSVEKTRKPDFGFKALGDVADHFREQLEAKGWVLRSEKGEEEAALHLFAYYKNGSGKVRKSPSITLYYAAFTYDCIAQMDGTTAMKNKRPRQRPWGLRSAERRGSWAKLDSAVPAFLSAAGVEFSAPA